VRVLIERMRARVRLKRVLAGESGSVRCTRAGVVAEPVGRTGKRPPHEEAHGVVDGVWKPPCGCVRYGKLDWYVSPIIESCAGVVVAGFSMS